MYEDEKEIEALRAGLRWLRFYLRSSKFFEEPYVNIQDVLLRIEEIEREADNARRPR